MRKSPKDIFVNVELWVRDAIEIEKKDHDLILQIFSMNGRQAR